MDNKVEIKENCKYDLNNKLIKILLRDHSSGKNIIWGTDNYKSRGKRYYEFNNISLKAITCGNGLVIKPRFEKTEAEQLKRVKDKAEVFTPSWVCNAQNNLVDSAWFGRENVFNIEKGKAWETNRGKIFFPENKTWQDYVLSNRMEISCGEAPYLCSRYDTVSGKRIEVNNRIGILDRKLRVIKENTASEEDWFEWTIKAYKSIYGFEWQGDSLFIARENLLFTFIDNFKEKFGEFPANEKLEEIAKIISWNIFQMDGLNLVVPNCNGSFPILQKSLLNENGGLKEDPKCNIQNNNQTYTHAKIMDWATKRSIKFINLLKEEG